jgi:hypothetical protein
VMGEVFLPVNPSSNAAHAVIPSFLILKRAQ